MPPRIIILYKHKGQTPLECIQGLKNEHPEWADIPMTYAGRLDPLASGVLLVLIGDECMKKEEYTGLSKEYEVEMLFGFGTDTYDVMGKIISQAESKSSGPRAARLMNRAIQVRAQPDHEYLLSTLTLALKKFFTGTLVQKYPAYSSRTVLGKPLHQWAREGRLDEIEIPCHEVSVDTIDVLGESEISGQKLLDRIIDDISKVKGDFRQEEIVHIWEESLKDKEGDEYVVLKLRIACSGGFYVRQFAHDLGEKVGIPALALSIVRTRVGEYVC